MTSSFVGNPRIEPSPAGRRALRLLAGALLLGAASCAAGEPLGEVAPSINKTLRSDFDVLVPGDVMEVRFGDLVSDNKVWDHEVLVRPDGNAAFLGLGDRPAGGQTVESLRSEIALDYQKLLKLRAVDRFSILLKTKVARSVIVMGEVHAPGSITFDGARMTLLEAIGRAGGILKESAELGSVLLVRWDPESKRQLAWKVDANFEEWSTPNAVYLQPYDVVYIPNSTIDKVDIWVDNYIRRLLPIPLNVSAISVAPH